jgi:hypothetical protein
VLKVLNTVLIHRRCDIDDVIPDIDDVIQDIDDVTSCLTAAYTWKWKIPYSMGVRFQFQWKIPRPHGMEWNGPLLKSMDLMVWFNRTPADFGQHTSVTIVLFNV